MSDCEKILKKYKDNFRNFNINFHQYGRYEDIHLEYGNCFLQKVDDDKLTNLENTSVNCIHKVYEHSAEKYFIKVQLVKQADSLQEESEIFTILNTSTICPTLISKFIVCLDVDRQNKYSIVKVDSKIKRPCIVTTAYTNFKDFFEVYDNTLQDLTNLGVPLFEKLNDFFVELIELSTSKHFVHNDLHMKNIIYDNKNNSLALLDFGRSYIDGAVIEEGVYRYKPNNSFHKTPVMTDIMCLCKTILDDMYVHFFNARRAQNDAKKVTLCNELKLILQPIGDIYKVEYVNKQLYVKFCKIDNLDINKQVTNPIASVLLPGIIYLVIYLNMCEHYLDIYKIDDESTSTHYCLPYDNFLNKKNSIDKYAPFDYGKITSSIYKENFNSDFGEFAINKKMTTGGRENPNSFVAEPILFVAEPNQFVAKLEPFEETIQIVEEPKKFDEMIKNCKEITHDQAYNEYIKSRDLDLRDLRNLDFGDFDITIDQGGGRRVLHLNNKQQ